MAHPAFNSTFVIDGEFRAHSSQEAHFASQIGLLEDGILSPILTTAVNVTSIDFSKQYKLLIIHPDSNLHHNWDLKLDLEHGLFAMLTLTDGTNNRHASTSVNYITDINRLDLSLTCQELEMKLGGQVDVDHVNGRYGAVVTASYDPLSPPLSISTTFERFDAERMRLVAELSVTQDRSYYAEAYYSPSAVSTQVIHHEYSTSHTAIQASVTLNDSQTISVRGRYHPELWANLTMDLSEPTERVALIASHLTTRLRSMMREEITLRLSSLSSSQTLATVYRRVIDHTRTQWTNLRQDFAAVRQLVLQMYAKDDFYIKTILEFSVSAIWEGKQMLGSGISKVQEAFKALFTRVLPEFMTSIYKSTLEPLVQGFQKFAPSFARFLRRLADSWRKVQSAVSATFRTTVTFIRDAAIAMTKYSSDRMLVLSNWIAQSKENLMNDVVTPWMKSLAELASALEDWFIDVNNLLSSIPIEIEKYFMSLEETKAIIKLYSEYASWLEEFQFAEIVTSFREALRSWYAGLIADLRAHIGEHAQYVTMALDAMKGTYDEVMSLPPVIYIRMVHSRINAKMVWIWEHYKLEQNLQELIIKISDLVVQTVMDWSDTSIEDYRQNSAFSDDDEKSFSYDPLTGDFVGTFSLPFKWTRFDQTPVLDNEFKDKFSNFRYAMMDRMYNLATETTDLKDTLYRTILPPFSSNALITVNGHVITFDGHHYKIKEQLCGTYLLAADYYDNKFSVSADYGSLGSLHSLILHTKTGRRVEIALDHEAKGRVDEEGFSKVIFDETKVELPANVDGFTLTREGQMVVASSQSGVALRCNVVAGLCSLELAGWFHGRVAGLAGSLDRELNNDVASPQGQSMDSISEFLKQWKLSKGADCNLPAKNKVRDGRTRHTSTCKRLFQNSESPLQPCFARLDPAPFRIMCDQDAAGYASNKPVGVVDTDNTRGPECLAAEAYVEQCKFVGMEISMPANCIRCRLPGGRSLTAGEVVIYDSAPGSRLPSPPALADVVFMVEHAWQGGESTCLQGSDLAELPAKLESVLRATLGINSTRFSLLSYGAGRAPAVHTLEGFVWNGRRSLQQVLSNLQLEATEEKATDRDLLEALLTAAAKLSFRAGASKSIVLAPCTSCARSEETATVFAEASSLLLEADVRLHVLQRDEMPFRRVKKRQPVNQGNLNPVMGVDLHGAYTGRRIKGTSIPLPSKAIMRQLSMPKDLCTPLALETNGTLFSASRLARRDQEQQAGDGKRKWLDVWSRRVASSAKPSPCQTCDCLPHGDGSSRTTCQPCVSPSIQNFLQEWEDFLEEEELEVEEGEDGTSIEVPDGLTSRVQEELEAERLVLNRLRDMLIQGHAIPEGL